MVVRMAVRMVDPWADERDIHLACLMAASSENLMAAMMASSMAVGMVDSWVVQME